MWNICALSIANDLNLTLVVMEAVSSMQYLARDSWNSEDGTSTLMGQPEKGPNTRGFFSGFWFFLDTREKPMKNLCTDEP